MLYVMHRCRSQRSYLQLGDLCLHRSPPLLVCKASIRRVHKILISGFPKRIIVLPQRETRFRPKQIPPLVRIKCRRKLINYLCTTHDTFLKIGGSSVGLHPFLVWSRIKFDAKADSPCCLSSSNPTSLQVPPSIFKCFCWYVY